MDNKLQELLTITMEECGELIQACSKAIRCDQYYDNDNLLEEIGDVQCMIELIHDYDLVSWEDVNVRMKVKKEKLKQWSNLILELNIMKKEWNKYAQLDIQAPGIKKILNWGTSNYDSKAEPEED